MRISVTCAHMHIRMTSHPDVHVRAHPGYTVIVASGIHAEYH